MISYSVEKIAGIVHGKLLNKFPTSVIIENIATDSRAVIKGNKTLFFALKSQRNNGHNYIPELITKGISAIIISEDLPNSLIHSKTSFIKVENTLTALQQLAVHHRKQFHIPVIGITGSNGKTIIKEWLYSLLEKKISIIRSPKSYNSQIGVPHSVWLVNNYHKLAIFEAGISKPGEMENLEKIIQPEIGILTNIGSAHQENFSSLKQKTEEKLKLFRYSKKLIFSADQESSELTNQFCQKHHIEKIDWSLMGNEALIQFVPEKGTNNHTRIFAKTMLEEYSFSIPFTDYSSIENACHCFATAYATGIFLTEILPEFRNLSSVAMRLEIKQGKNNCILINDFYNSDINALEIALTTLEAQALKGHLKKVLIISDIKQSGVQPVKLYSDVKTMAAKAGIEKIIGIGKDLISVQNIFSSSDHFFPDTNAFLNSFNFSDFKNSAILIKGARDFNFENISFALQEKAHQTVLEIDLNALIENLNYFRSLLYPGTKIMAMVKAFSYGSGSVEIAKILQFHGIDYLAVAVADEGVELRNAGITTPVVIMNPEPYSFQNIIDYKLEPNLYSTELLHEFSNVSRYNALTDCPVHIKIDTGMNRLGFKTKEEILIVTETIKKSGSIRISSVFSHLAGSDDPGLDSFTTEQIKTFEVLSNLLTSTFKYKIQRHILNSAGIERFSDYQLDMVRLGIGLYGISSAGNRLKNISTLKTTVSQIKNIEPDETIGYNRKGRVSKPSKIAVIPIGYADGLKRSLGNKNGRVYINGHYVPIIGNICMDMCMIDVTDKDVKVGDSVEIFGPHIPVSELAEKTGTIPYEILTGISQRVKRIYLQE